MMEVNQKQPTLRWTIRQARALAAVAGIAALSVAAACGGDSGGVNGPATFSTPAGSYDVATVNAKSLPVAIFSDSGFTWEVTAGALVLAGDGKYSTKMTFRQTVPGDVSTFVDSTGGTWALAAGIVTFTNASDGSVDRADWSNTGKLTFTETEGRATNTYVFAIRR